MAPTKSKIATSSEWTKHLPQSHLVESFYFDTVHTGSVLPLKASDNIPLLFYIPGLEKIHIALDQIWIKIAFKIMKKSITGARLDSIGRDSKVAPVCGFLYTMFQDIECFINDELLDSSKQNYQVIIFFFLNSYRRFSLGFR